MTKRYGSGYTLADISAALFSSEKCCVNAALVAPLATPATGL